MDAIARAGATASRAVFFSGMTVVPALTGMLLIPMDVFNSLAAGAIFVVSVAVLASLTLLPAVLSLLGDKIDKLSIPIIGRAQERSDEQNIGGFWDTVSRGVMKQPLVSLLLAAGLLIAAAIPFFDLNPGFADAESFPDELDSKKGFIIASQEFPDLLTNQVRVVIDGAIDDGGVQDALESLTALMDADGSFGRTQLEVNGAQDLAVVSAAILGGDAASRPAVDAVLRLRDTYVPDTFGSLSATEVLVAGETAFNIDFFVVARDYAPIVFGFVLTMSFILLTVVFRSIVVSLESILLNLLSVGAAYGLLVLVFQKGGWERVLWSPANRCSGGLATVIPLLHPVRPIHGLPHLPVEPHKRAFRPDRRQHRFSGLWRTYYGPVDHRRGPHNGRRFRRFRQRQSRAIAANGIRTGCRHTVGCDHSAHGIGALGNEAFGGLELVSS